MSTLHLKPAHDELQKLLQEIEKAGGESSLPESRGRTIPLRADWLEALKKVRTALPEWCGNNGFSLEVPSKR